jgi:hypothetical protein
VNFPGAESARLALAPDFARLVLAPDFARLVLAPDFARLVPLRVIAAHRLASPVGSSADHGGPRPA